jgi:hypothetical protein
MATPKLQNQPQAITATIANAASLSGIVDLGATRLVGIVIPAAWTAANLTFSVSRDGVTFVDLYDNFGAEYTVTVGGVNRRVLVPYSDFFGVRWLKVRSGTSATPVNQAAQRDLILISAP